MAASVFSSELFNRLFPVGEAGRLFSDSAEVRAMLLVEGTLAKAQGELGMIPQESAQFIHRSSLELQVDPGGLAAQTGVNGVPVPALVEAFRKLMEAPEHAQYVHWGATSQDIIDTGLVLRLRQFLSLLEKQLTDCVKTLGHLAQDHADSPMIARTFSQPAGITSFGALAARWGEPLLGLLDDLATVRQNSLWVSLSGGVGTSAAFGDQASELRAAVAKALNLGDPGRTWHTDRTPILTVAAWLTRVSQALCKIAQDIVILTQGHLSEVSLSQTGHSSTLPQKQNPVQPGAIIAMAQTTIGLNTTLQNTGHPQLDRDGAMLFTEWMTVPPLCLGLAAMTGQSLSILQGLKPNVDRMHQNLEDTSSLLCAEALSFALADILPKPEAQAAVTDLCQQARQTGQTLHALAAQAYPDQDFTQVFTPSAQMGTATTGAKTFAQKASAL